jgi:hypothetical protein
MVKAIVEERKTNTQSLLSKIAKALQRDMPSNGSSG